MRVEREIDRGRIDFSEERGRPAATSQGLPLLDPRQTAETAVETDSDQKPSRLPSPPQGHVAAAVAGTCRPTTPTKETAAARRRRQFINRLGLGPGSRPGGRFAGPRFPSIGHILSAGRDGANSDQIDSTDDLSSEDDGKRGHISGYSSGEMDH
jgi:hypothetical protein